MLKNLKKGNIDLEGHTCRKNLCVPFYNATVNILPALHSTAISGRSTISKLMTNDFKSI